MDSKNKLLLVVNPISGGSGKEQLIQEITEVLNHRKVVFTTYETTGEKDESHIRKIIETQSIQKIMVVGGDGTIQTVAKAVDKRDVALSLIPAGSANGLASNFQFPTTVEDQIDIALGDSYILLDMISINDHLCLHIADLGINATLIKNYENSEIRGKLGYALQTIPTLMESDLPYSFSLTIDDQTINLQGVMVAIANAKQFGTGAVINPEGQMDDGIFEVLIFKKLMLIDILKTLDEDSYRNPEFVECYPATKVSIACPSEVSLQVDGEFIGNVKRVSAELLSTKLKIMVPTQEPNNL
ncbi:diacylglycerol/lipid kinase family protein [Gelidibacter salicanalis]|uniref:YegS/Rv2252/BmrU family lipid kinase n=1 Tax=Gelidibacter salicanalis TaxID=291193 RepID=A0A934KTN0_9FLAO|nr:YegS/Rv2252/BmrU family lipid kinase [Gelidibacter salicanalis]MBJ7881156.1 YegS/Rv2252/BmrU family lipid kinase [Gelidibacter salicanalis]